MWVQRYLLTVSESIIIFVYMKKKESESFNGGFVRNKGEGRGVRVAAVKVTDLMAVAEPRMAQERLSSLQDPEVAKQVMKPVQARKTALAVMGIPAAALDKGSPEYARCVRLANGYRKARNREYYLAHGHVSSGVSALLASAAMALSASRYLYEIASETEIDGTIVSASTRAGLLKQASSLSDSARQNELSAWELCAREAVVRKRNDMDNANLPWLINSSGAGLTSGNNVGGDGAVKRGRGRPRKVNLVTEDQNYAGTVNQGTNDSVCSESESGSEPEE